MEDAEIIRLYEERDQQAISRSQERYGGYCYSIGYNILYSKEDTEECVNETWLKAWNAIPPQKPGKLSVFLGSITRNLALDRYKGRKRIKRGGGEFPQILEELDECVPDRSTTDEEIDRKLLGEILSGFVASLSEQDRAVFLSRYWYAMPIKSISEKFSLNENTVKSVLFRSRSKLKKRLEEEGITV